MSKFPFLGGKFSFFGCQNFLFWITKFPKKENLMVYKLFLETEFQKFPFSNNIISKKGYFDGLYKQIM